MLLRTLLLLLLPGTSHWLSAQQKTSIPVTVRLSTHGNVVFKPASAQSATEGKQYGLLDSDPMLVRQLENRNGLLIYTPEAAKGKDHSLITIGLLPTHTPDLQLAKGEVRFEEIDNTVTGSIGGGNVIIRGGKANVSLQLQSGDITVQQSQWQGTVQTGKGNILLEDSPQLKGYAPNGTVTHRYTETGLKDKNRLIQQFEKGNIEVIGAAPMVHLELLEGEIMLEGKTEEAFLFIRDRGNVTVKQAGKKFHAGITKGKMDISALPDFETMEIDCERGEVNLHIPKSFKGTVKILSEVMGAEKPEFKLSHFWQEEQPVFKAVEMEGKAVAGYFRYSFEKKIGEGTSLLLVHLKNTHLQINPL